ncbi:O-antigen ligase family protein [Parabacteroides distasonis]|nr:O-antigen ligase family protein [Parabacteroides distasonis]
MFSLNPAKLNRCDWFIIVWVVYYLQGILYPNGGVISTVLLGINLIVSIGCATKVWKLRSLPRYFKGLNLLIIMFTIYGFALILFNPSVIHYNNGLVQNSYVYIKAIYLSLLPIYGFYYFGIKGYLTSERLCRWAIIFCISCVLSYYFNMQQALIELMANGSSRNEITNNIGYSFLSLIPVWVLFRKKPVLQYVGLAFCMAYIIMGMKRGAILIGGVVVCYLLWNIIRSSRGKLRFFILFMTFVLGIATIYFIADLMDSSEFFLQRIQDTREGNTSERDDLYSFFWIYFTERTEFFNFIFGNGANSTLNVYNSYAHNDWFEIAINQGLLGIIVYVFYWKQLYSTWRSATNIEAKTILALVSIIYFSKTLFSMSYGDMTYVCTSVLGYALATYKEPNFN